MFKSLKRFVGIFIFIGVFASSALACDSGQIQVQSGGNTGCVGLCVNGNCIPSGWTLYCDNGGAAGYRSCYIAKEIEATGCRYNNSDNTIREAKRLKKKNYDCNGYNRDYYDPNTQTYFSPYCVNQSDWEHVWYSDYQAMPGYTKTINNDGNCTKCTGHGYSVGGEIYTCTPCPWYGGDTSEVNDNPLTSGICPGAVQGSTTSDGTKCVLGGVQQSDETGTYTSGTCEYTDPWFRGNDAEVLVTVADAAEFLYQIPQICERMGYHGPSSYSSCAKQLLDNPGYFVETVENIDDPIDMLDLMTYYLDDYANGFSPTGNACLYNYFYSRNHYNGNDTVAYSLACSQMLWRSLNESSSDMNACYQAGNSYVGE